MEDNNYAVIMAGGIGTRFWPMSNSSLPKQFLDILGSGETLLQQTFRRLKKVCRSKNILVVTNRDYIDICRNQLPDLLEENILSEPARKNTAPCIAYASFKISLENPNARIIVAPSDHLILNEEEFIRSINNCFDFIINQSSLVTLGINPSFPATGYGYIQFSEESIKNSEIKKVKVFTEKPDLEIAKQFLLDGTFLWNSGMFIWGVNSIINEFKNHLPEIYNLFSRITKENIEKSSFIEDIFSKCKNVSIDYGILEKSNNVFVYPSSFGWTDLGTWGSLYDHLDLDVKENALLNKEVLLYNSKRNIVSISPNKACVIEGLDGYIIVDTDDALLICRKEKEQEIKQFVKDVKHNLGERYV